MLGSFDETWSFLIQLGTLFFSLALMREIIYKKYCKRTNSNNKNWHIFSWFIIIILKILKYVLAINFNSY